MKKEKKKKTPFTLEEDFYWSNKGEERLKTFKRKTALNHKEVFGKK